MKHNPKEITCPQCSDRNTFRMWLDITISCPYGIQAITKTNLRKSSFRIEAADWESSRIYCCNCGYRLGEKVI